MYTYDRRSRRVASLQKRDIQKALDAAGVDYESFSNDGGGFKGKGWTIYWDAQDSSDEGWAYRHKGDSDSIDDKRDLQKVIEKFGK